MLGIDWKNGQAGGTPLSAENLKLMQSLIETEIANQVQDLSIDINKLKGTTLFRNTSGVNISQGITLNDDVENYDYVEILFGKNYDNGLASVKCYPAINKYISVTVYIRTDSSGSGAQLIATKIHVNENTLSQIDCQFINFNDDSNVRVGDTNEIKVFQVLGYKINNS